MNNINWENSFRNLSLFDLIVSITMNLIISDFASNK